MALDDRERADECVKITKENEHCPQDCVKHQTQRGTGKGGAPGGLRCRVGGLAGWTGGGGGVGLWNGCQPYGRSTFGSGRGASGGLGGWAGAAMGNESCGAGFAAMGSWAAVSARGQHKALQRRCLSVLMRVHKSTLLGLPGWVKLVVVPVEDD